MTMKKILFFILFFPLFSCDDWLDVDSEISVTYQNYFDGEADLEALLITMLESPSSYLDIFDWASLLCDNVQTNSQGFRKMEPTMIWGSNDISWGYAYKVIYLANMLESNRHRFKNISEERADYWIAQANFIKGLTYFNIARKWGDAPIAPTNTEDASPRAKSPVDSVLAEAIRAAKKALILPTYDKLTDANGDKVTSRQFASIGTVHTLLANIYAWLGGLHGDKAYWEKAEQEASYVIDGQAGHYELVSLGDLVTKTFGPARDVTEVIYAIESNPENEDRFYQGGFYSKYPGWELINYPYSIRDPQNIERNIGVSRISVETVEQLYREPRDLRRKEYWLNLGEPIMIEKFNEDTEEVELVEFLPTYAYLNKWRTPYFSTNPDVSLGGTKLLGMEGNIVKWRLADVILLRAECRAQLGMAEATDDLNRIRARAGLGNYRGSQDKKTLLREIFDERDRELFGETCRYYDIVRNGYTRELLEGNYKALTDEDIKNGALYLPVGENAFMKNTLMSQNTYWSWHQIK